MDQGRYTPVQRKPEAAEGRSMKSTADRLIDTLNDAQAIAGLEMLEEPELMRYVTSKNAQMMKREKQRKFRIKVIRRVLQSDLKLSSSQSDHQYYIKVLEILRLPDNTLLPALEKIRNVFNQIGFAQHVQMMSQMDDEARQLRAGAFSSRSMGAT